MDEFVNQLVAKVGIDKATAEKVVNFVKEHIDDIPQWIGKSEIMDKLPLVGGLFGNNDDDKKD